VERARGSKAPGAAALAAALESAAAVDSDRALAEAAREIAAALVDVGAGKEAR
jgi:hypothetical protein